MLLFVEFDINADIIDVPQSIIDDREDLRRRFLKWLYDKNTKHKYWHTFPGGEKGVIYRSDAFVEFLNKKVLRNSEQKAVIVQQEIPIEDKKNLPSVFF